MGKPTDLIQGTLDLMILKTIVLQPLHGWAIAQRIRQLSRDVLQVNQGALYPALHRLEHNGWIKVKTLKGGVQVWENPDAILPKHGQQGHAVVLATTHGAQLYLIIYSAPVNGFEVASVSAFQPMLNSFAFAS